MKQEERREQTKRLLHDTTVELIREKGCSQTTLSDIMERSGLSKGAIFHYVSGKDELFVQVLENRLEEKNEQFMNVVKGLDIKEFEAPMNVISSGLSRLENKDDVANLILIYLIGKSDQPKVAEIVGNFYNQSIAFSKNWIMTGQNSGVIPAEIDPGQTAELFELIAFGLRMRNLFAQKEYSFGVKEYSAFISGLLQSTPRKEEE
ncbi:TetR/AcrR family transcriptional regulator [Paenibacillus nasutitermitis]|uniref:HTH tetR-type domain-containing protein n=1 Tax=Paenibacillus nasutitermitis TaxID=1652958 RepID=A0A917DPF2_9BACL|nr:TetR/AcrR family transcriptional regulator [Paenibacillus nasutitermitis]GGD57361.1 hypothetical protein GCM10010911_13960 [Paenibacillus nasutitermitis]